MAPHWNTAGIHSDFHMSLHMTGGRNSWHFTASGRPGGQLATYHSESTPPTWDFSTQGDNPDYKVALGDLSLLVSYIKPSGEVVIEEGGVVLDMAGPELRAMLLLLLNQSGEADLVELAVTAGLRLQPSRVPLVF